MMFRCVVLLVCVLLLFLFFKQKTAYEMRISDWSSDVCSSDLDTVELGRTAGTETAMTDEDVAPEQGEMAITRTGDRLRLAREEAGLSLADVAPRTRITKRHLAAIAKSAFSELTGRTYGTSFARPYARAVDLTVARTASLATTELPEENG